MLVPCSLLPVLKDELLPLSVTEVGQPKEWKYMLVMGYVYIQ